MGVFFLDWRMAYLFWAIPMLLGIVGVLSIRTKPLNIRNNTIKESQPKPQGESFFNYGMMFFLLFISIRAMAQQMLGVFIPIYLVDEKGLSENLSSFIFGSSSMMGLIGAPLGGFLASKIGEKKWLLIVLLFACASLSLALIIPNLIVFIILYLFYGFSNTLAMSARSALMAWFSPSNKRGLGYSLYFLPGSIMGILAPILAANVAETFGLTSIFYVTIAINIIGIFLLKFGINIPNQMVE
jgi:MFS family permease